MSNQPPAGSSLLFGMLAKSAQIEKRNKNFRMTLGGVNVIDWFTDRPDRDAGYWSPKKLVKDWNKLFGNVEPNAQASVTLQSGRRELVTFEMNPPKLDKAGNLSFRVKPIGTINRDEITGLTQRVLNGVSVFIDDATTTADVTKTMTISLSSPEDDAKGCGYLYDFWLTSLSPDAVIGKPTSSNTHAELDDGTLVFSLEYPNPGYVEFPVTLKNGLKTSDMMLYANSPGQVISSPCIDPNEGIRTEIATYSIESAPSGTMAFEYTGAEPPTLMPSDSNTTTIDWFKP